MSVEIQRATAKSPLDAAARLILDEVENLSDSAPRATLNRLEEIARELERIEDSL